MTNSLTELKNRVIEYLSGLAAFADATVVPAYPEKRRAFPLVKPVITVEAAGVEAVPAGLGGYLGGDTPVYGMTALVTLRFGIYAERSADCGLLFESLAGALFDAAWLGVHKTHGERCEFDTKTAAHLLPATASVKAAWIVPKQEERLFSEVTLKEELIV